MSQGIMALGYKEGGATSPQTLQEKARVRKMLQELAMDGKAPDKTPAGQPDLRLVNGEWVVMVNGQPYRPVGMTEGGTVPTMYGGRSPEEVQASLRGQYVVPPPPGYVPGFNPEMMYFQNDPENPVYPPYGGPEQWTQMYAGSPINRFNPAGGAYFPPLIPGLPPTPLHNAGQPFMPSGGITGLIPGTYGNPNTPPPPGAQVTGPPSDVIPDGPGVTRDPGGANVSGGYGSPNYGYGGGGGYGLGVGGAYGTAAPMFGGSSGGGGGFNDYLNRAIPAGDDGYGTYNPFVGWMAEHGGGIGAAAGAILGFPGGGLIGGWLGDRYLGSHPQQSPMDGTNMLGEPIAPITPGNDLINQALADNPGSEESLRELVGGQQSAAGPMEFYGTLGSWYGFRQPGGGIKWINSRSLTNDNAAGGQVTLKSSLGPVKLAGGGIAELPTEFSQGPPMPPQGMPPGMAPSGPPPMPPQGMPPQGMPQPSPEEVQMVAAAINGAAGAEADQIINMFIQRYGTEVFRMIRDMVLQQNAPGAQTEGMISGPGGGMDDMIPGMIGNQQPVAVSPGEYIVPADVVSGLGDGSSDAGAEELDRMLQNVRMARGGTTTQPPPLNASKVLPA